MTLPYRCRSAYSDEDISLLSLEDYKKETGDAEAEEVQQQPCLPVFSLLFSGSGPKVRGDTR